MHLQRNLIGPGEPCGLQRLNYWQERVFFDRCSRALSIYSLASNNPNLYFVAAVCSMYFNRPKKPTVASPALSYFFRNETCQKYVAIMDSILIHYFSGGAFPLHMEFPSERRQEFYNAKKQRTAVGQLNMMNQNPP